MPDNRLRHAEPPSGPPEGVSQGDYRLIEEAVMETPRGRWFLREYARRIRVEETDRLVTAILRLEQAMALREPVPPPSGGVQQPDPRESCEYKAHGSREDSVPQRNFGSLHDCPDVANRIGQVQEKLLDIVWYMRERGFDGRLCTAIRNEALKLSVAADAGLAPQMPEASSAREFPAEDDVQQRAPAPDADAGAGAVLPAEPLPDENIQTALLVAHAAPEEAPPPVGDREMQSLPPSRIAALAQRAAAFSAIDGLDEKRKLALFS